VDTENEPIKIYDDNDHTEDYYMVDKALVSDLNLDGLIPKLAFGEARYGERIFDQKSNLLQKAIMKSNRTAAEKKRLIGQHIYSELKTHADMGGESNIQVREFAKGSEVTPADKIKTPARMKQKVIDFQKKYNEWAKQNSQPTIKVDGTYGNETENAIQNWNINNPITDSFSIKTGTTIDPKTGKESQTLAGIDYQVKESVRNPQIQLNTDPLNPQIETPLAGNLKKIATDLSTGTAPITAVAPPKNTPAADPNLTPNDRANLFGNISDIASAGIGAMLGSTKIPKYAPTEEYNNMFSDIVANKNTGFTPEEWASINQGIQGNYAQSVETIRGITGGGGTTGAVLGAIGAASGQRDNAVLAAAVQDSALARQNNGIYRNAVLTDLNLDQQQYEAERNNALASKTAGLQLLDSSLTNIAERRQFNESFGPGTEYDLFNQSLREGIQTQQDKEKAQIDMLRRFYNSQINKPLR